MQKYLESLLLQIFTIEDRTEMEAHVPSAKEYCRFYNPVVFSSLDLKEKIEASWFKVFIAICTSATEYFYVCLCMPTCWIFMKFHFGGQFDSLLQASVQAMDDKLKKLRQRLSNDHAKILHCLDSLGLICASEVW